MPRRLFAAAIVPLMAALLTPVGASASAPAPAPVGSSCAAIKAGHPSVSLVCAGTAAAPSVFLVLQRTGAGQNFSQFTAGGTISGTNVVTSYTALRLDPTPVSTSPLTFRVNIADQTFSTSTGSACCLGTERITSMPYAVAADCNTPGSATGVADIDLTGTGFVVASTFTVQGFLPGGATVKLSPQVVALSGGGFCGANAPTGSSGLINADAINDASGGFDFRISLQ